MGELYKMAKAETDPDRQLGEFDKKIEFPDRAGNRLAPLGTSNIIDPTICYSLGCQREEKLEYKEAEAHFQDAFKLAPDNYDILYKLGTVSLLRNKLQEAESYFLRCQKVRDDSPRVLFHLGIIAYKAENWNKAAEYFARTVKLNNEFSDTWYMLGLSYVAQDKLVLALEALEQAAVRSPNQLDVHFSLGNVYLQMFRYKDAVVEFQKALTLAPNSAKMLLGLCRLYFMKGDCKPAEAILQKLLKISSGNRCADMLKKALAGNPQEMIPGKIFSMAFGTFPEQFDDGMVNELKYCLPPRVKQAIQDAAGKDIHFINAIDLGCNNGLSGQQFSEFAGNLAGIDISREKMTQSMDLFVDIYSEMQFGDIIEILAKNDRKFDLVTASELIICAGDLNPLFTQISRHTSPSGYFAFAVENTDVANFVMSRTGLFAHSAEFIEKLAEKYGFDIVYCEECGCRSFTNILIYVLKKK